MLKPPTKEQKEILKALEKSNMPMLTPLLVVVKQLQYTRG